MSRSSRDSNNLRGRRVVVDGRAGVIRSNYQWDGERGLFGKKRETTEPVVVLRVKFDDYAVKKAARDALPPEERKHVQLVPWIERVELPVAEVGNFVLPAPALECVCAALAVDVRRRKVVFRGHKEQVAQRLDELSALTDEQLAAGYERYVEFTPDVAAYKRRRIVLLLPPMEYDAIKETPDEHPRAASERLRGDYDDRSMY